MEKSFIEKLRELNEDEMIVFKTIAEAMVTQKCPNCGDELEALGEGDFACWSCEVDWTFKNGGLELRPPVVAKS